MLTLPFRQAIAAIVYKEWLKIRHHWWLTLAANLAFMTYLWLDIRQLFRVEHAEMLYYQANQIGTVFYQPLQFVPLISALFLAVMQVLPEMQQRRFRLAMHLPVTLNQLLMGFVFFGLVAVTSLLCLDAVLLFLIIQHYFPIEFAYSALETAFPWFWAGMVAYLSVVVVMLEPNRWRQGAMATVCGLLVWQFYQSTDYGAYRHVMGELGIISGLLLPAVLVSAARYRHGSSQ